MKEKKNENRDEVAIQMDKAIENSGINLEPSVRVKLNHSLDQVIRDVTEPMKTKCQVRNEVNYLCCTFSLEPKLMSIGYLLCIKN